MKASGPKSIVILSPMAASLSVTQQCLVLSGRRNLLPCVLRIEWMMYHFQHFRCRGCVFVDTAVDGLLEDLVPARWPPFEIPIKTSWSRGESPLIPENFDPFIGTVFYEFAMVNQPLLAVVYDGSTAC